MAADPQSNIALQKLQNFEPDAVEEARSFRGETTIYIRSNRLRDVCEFLRDMPDLSFKFLSDLTAVDHFPSEPRFETIYHLLSFETNERLRLKVRIAGQNPRVDS